MHINCLSRASENVHVLKLYMCKYIHICKTDHVDLHISNESKSDTSHKYAVLRTQSNKVTDHFFLSK